MKILEQTPKRLVFYSRPIGLWLFTAIFPTVGLLIGIFFIDINSFSCKRQGAGNDLCQKSTTSALGTRTTQIPLNELLSAEVKQKYDQDGTLYRAEINTKQGSIPLSEVWEGGGNTRRQDEITYQINNFLRNSQQKSISITLYPSAILLIWFFLWMPISILIFLAVAQIRICTFDKNLHKLKIESKGLISQKTTEYPLEEISDVIISPEGMEGNSIPPNPVYIVLNSGQRISVYLALDSFSNNGEWQQKALENINLIKTFLGFST
jgi:hypothetical protein